MIELNITKEQLNEGSVVNMVDKTVWFNKTESLVFAGDGGRWCEVGQAHVVLNSLIPYCGYIFIIHIDGMIAWTEMKEGITDLSNRETLDGFKSRETRTSGFIRKDGSMGRLNDDGKPPKFLQERGTKWRMK